MGLFRRKPTEEKRCPMCRFYVMLEGKGYCAKDLPSTINVRLLSREGIVRQCGRCPAEMTCGAWTVK